MTYNPEKHRRRSIRLKGYDYTQEGAYFVTICTYNRQCILGGIVAEEMRLSEFGKIVETEWLSTEEIRQNIEMDEHVVMPNHLHGILVITEQLVGATGPVAPTTVDAPNVEEASSKVVPRLQPNSLGSILGQIKLVATKKIRQRGLSNFKWQRNYYEHIIRDEEELNRIREYIIYNPLRWEIDRDNPKGIPDEQEKQFWQEFGESN